MIFEWYFFVRDSPESVIKRSIKTNLHLTLKMKDAVNTSSSNIKATVAMKQTQNGKADNLRCVFASFVPPSIPSHSRQGEEQGVRVSVLNACHTELTAPKV